MLVINDNITIPSEYLTVRFVRSQGPGGQNVNKVNTKCQLSFNILHCRILPGYASRRLIQLAGRRYNAGGAVVIESDRYRMQSRNRQDCQDRLADLIHKSLIQPKKRRPTRTPVAVIKKRLENKKRRGQIKQLRKKPGIED